MGEDDNGITRAEVEELKAGILAMAPSTNDLLTWLRAQLDDEELVARAACHGGTGTWVRPARYISRIDDEAGHIVVYGEGTPSPEEATHIVRHAPARVLAEVEVTRRLIDRYERAVGVISSVSRFQRGQDDGYRQACLDAIRDRAEVYADQPGYRDEWRPVIA